MLEMPSATSKVHSCVVRDVLAVTVRTLPLRLYQPFWPLPGEQTVGVNC
jgi:hypothetical protein